MAADDAGGMAGPIAVGIVSRELIGIIFLL
jgi:hypothetical protein